MGTWLEPSIAASFTCSVQTSKGVVRRGYRHEQCLPLQGSDHGPHGLTGELDWGVWGSGGLFWLL